LPHVAEVVPFAVELGGGLQVNSLR
jgi:hypothetical protein